MGKSVFYEKSVLKDIINIESTNICNAHCLMCPREKMQRKLGIMETPLFKKIADQCAENKIKEVNMTGIGESFIDPNFLKKVKYLKSLYDPIVSITTNASLLTEEKARELIDTGADELNISCYSVKKETYEKIHRGLNFETTMKNIQNLKKLKEELGATLPVITTYFMDMGINSNEKELWYKTMRRLADVFKLEFDKHNFTVGRKYNKTDKSRWKLSCLFPHKTIQIYWNGDVCSCCFDFNGLVVFGNLHNESLYDIVKGKKYNEFCRTHTLRQYNKNPRCPGCDQLVNITPYNILRRVYYAYFKRDTERNRRYKFFEEMRKKHMSGMKG